MDGIDEVKWRVEKRYLVGNRKVGGARGAYEMNGIF